MKTQKPFVIGIDTGTSTGIAIWNREKGCFESIQTLAIHQAMEIVKEYTPYCKVRVEDARKRKWFGNAGRERLMGAGSVRRDAVVWEDFLTDLGVEFEMVAPKNNKTKLTAESFKKMTGWKERTSVHSRDAAMLCFGL